MSCADCPELVVGTIAREVQKTLDKVRRVKELTRTFNRLLTEIQGKIEDDLQALIDRIPTPPVLDISDIIDYYQCPLTPIAVQIDLTILRNMDPRLVGQRLAVIIRSETEAVIRLYEEAVRRLRSYDLVRLVRKYIQEVYRVMEDATRFVLEYPVNLGRALLVKELCPDIYADPGRPFKALVDEVTTWSFDGLMPSDIDSRARSVVRVLAQGESKLLAWKTLGTVIV